VNLEITKPLFADQRDTAIDVILIELYSSNTSLLS